jgi:hypothetical protein
MSDEQELLILYLAGELEPGERESLERRLSEDSWLRSELEALQGALSLVGDSTPGEPSEGYWRSFWPRLQPKLSRENPWGRLKGLLAPRHGLRLAGGLATLAAMLIAALLILYQVMVPQVPEPVIKRTEVKIQRTEGYFEMFADSHLERSRLLLQEVVNMASNGAPNEEALLDNRKRGEELLSQNRSYRMAALRNHDEKLAALLDELETVLMDIANIDTTVADEALVNLQQRIRRKDLLAKIDIVSFAEKNNSQTSDSEVM